MLPFIASCLLAVLQTTGHFLVSSYCFQTFFWNGVMVISMLLGRWKTSFLAQMTSGVLASFLLYSGFDNCTLLSFYLLLLMESRSSLLLTLSITAWIAHPLVCIILLLVWILLAFLPQGKAKRTVLFTLFIYLTPFILPSSSMASSLTSSSSLFSMTTRTSSRHSLHAVTATSTLLQLVHWVVLGSSIVLVSQTDYPSTVLLILFVTWLAQPGSYLWMLHIVLSHIFAVAAALKLLVFVQQESGNEEQQIHPDCKVHSSSSSSSCKQIIARILLVISVTVLVGVSFFMTVQSSIQSPVIQPATKLDDVAMKSGIEEANAMMDYFDSQSIPLNTVLRFVRESGLSVEGWNAIVGKREEDAYHAFALSSFQYILFTPWDVPPHPNDDCSLFSIVHGGCEDQLYSFQLLYRTNSSLFSLYRLL